MKRVIFTATLGVVCVSAFAQGQFNFANFGAGANAPVYDTDGVTKLGGTAWEADLYWGPGTLTDSTLLTALGQPTYFASSGYFLGGSRTIPGQPGGSTITAQVRVWDTVDGYPYPFPSPTARFGESALFQIVLTTPPDTPHSLTGLQPFSLHPIPEPSTLGLLGLGLAVIWRQRRIEGHAPMRQGRRSSRWA